MPGYDCINQINNNVSAAKEAGNTKLLCFALDQWGLNGHTLHTLKSFFPLLNDAIHIHLRPDQ